MTLSIISPFLNIGIQSTYAASPSDVLITEVEYDSLGTENEGEWVELYNPTGSAISLSGWTLGEAATGVEYAFTGGAVIASESFLLLVNDTTVFNTEHPGIVPDIDMEKTDSPSCVSNGECIRLNNTSGDSLTLKDETGTIIDHMAWEDLDGYDLNGDAGFSVCRRNLTDTDTDSEWSNNCEPTPGMGTFVTQFPGGVPVASLLWSKVDSEAYAHGDTMTVLNDRSGNDRDGDNSGTPSFDTTNTINFYPTASLDGSSDGFIFPEYSFPIGDKNYTMYSVFSSPLSQNDMTLQYVGRNSGTNNSTITYIDSDGSTHDDFDNGASNLNSSPASSVSVNTPTIVSFNYNSLANTKQTFINGENVANLSGVANHNASNTATSDRGVGFNADSSSNYFAGNIAEVLAYDSELDSTSKQKIDSYLALKYGITLDQTIVADYINSSGAVLWNATTNAQYTNNIIGVGQNNLSDLDQKISHSINTGAILTLSTSNDFISLNTALSRTSLDDGKFIVVGSNTGSIITQTGELDSALYTSRLTREWKVQNTGNVGGVFLKFDGFDEDVVLLTDSDGDFSAGVTNNGPLNADGTKTITLVDGEYFTLATPVTNNPPTDMTLSGSSIDENNSVGDTIGTLTSVDLDISDTHIYTLVSGTGDTDNTSFTLSGATLLAGEAFDYESQTSYSIRVQTDDGNGGAYEEIIVISINDLDEVAPIITLIGSGTITHEVNTLYADLGAEYSDNVDGTGAVVGTGSIDTTMTGSYILMYDYTDSSSNPALQVIRTINVVDTTPPVIVLTGSGTISHELDTTYIDAGATCSDNYDTSCTPTSSGSVDTTSTGSYIIYYDAIDISGNPATQITRTIDVVDTTAPSIPVFVSIADDTGTSSGDLITYDNTLIITGTADPNSEVTIYVDGVDTGSTTTSATGTFIFDGSSASAQPDGVYDLSFTSEDASGNISGFSTVTSITIDTELTVITLIGSGTITQEVYSSYADPGATYTDNIDGTGAVVGVGTVDTTVIGSYMLTYDYTDIAGNIATQVTRTVSIVDTTSPVVTLNGSNPETILLSGNFTDSGASWTDNVDGSGSINPASSGSVDTSTLGNYILEYIYTDTSGNNHTVTRTVNVVSGEFPILSVIGNSTITQEVGTSYTDSGASANDVEDDNNTLTNQIVAIGNVDTTVLGTYEITYYVTDSNLNAAAPVTRTVEVVDTTDPIITLNGNSTITQEVGISYIDLGAEWTDNYDGNGSVTGSGGVDINTVGIYYLTYDFSDSSGNIASQVTRTINIIDVIEPVDTTDPIVSLIGDSVITLEINSVFTDQGANWIDNIDGSGTLLIASSGSIDTSTAGTYILEYTYVDDAGNNNTVTRTVIIEDTSVPVVVENNNGGGGYSKRSTDGNLTKNTEETEDEEKIPYTEAQGIANEIVENSEVTKHFDELSEKILSERTKEINGEVKVYSLNDDYNSCKTIDNLLDENYTDSFQTQLQDISDSDQKELIKRLEKTGVVDGTQENIFEGTREVSRVEFLKIVLRSHCIEYRNQDPSDLAFRDLDNNIWQAKVVKKSIDLGIANGDKDEQGNKIFRADDIISSIEATKILMRMALVQQGTEPTTQYKDLEVEWHENYVKQGEYLGVFNPEGDNYLFNPNDGIDRNKTVEFLYKVIELYR